MSNRIGFIEKGASNFFQIDISNLSGQELLDAVLRAMKLVGEISEKTNFLIDVTDCKPSMEGLGYLKITGKQLQPIVNKSAVIGISNIIKPFLLSHSLSLSSTTL